MKIADVMKKKGFTYASLAEVMQVDPNSIWRWQAEKRQPSLKLLVKMADIFDCSIDELLGRNPTQQVQEKKTA